LRHHSSGPVAAFDLIGAAERSGRMPRVRIVMVALVAASMSSPVHAQVDDGKARLEAITHGASCDIAIAAPIDKVPKHTVESCAIHGQLLVEGRGVARDVAEGMRRLEWACVDGLSGFGCLALAEAQSRDPESMDSHLTAETGRERLSDGCHRDRVAGDCFTLGDAYRTGLGLDEDAAAARTLYSKGMDILRAGCDDGTAQACFDLAEAQESGDRLAADPAAGSRSLARGLSLLDKACHQFNSPACLDLARKHDLLADDARAAAAYERAVPGLTAACKDRMSDACFKLAWMYKSGRGVRADAKRAQELYAEACRLGEEVACEEVAPAR
jgi:TPR repeat protein